LFKEKEMAHPLIFLIYMAILNILIACVYKVILDCQHITIKHIIII